MCAACMLEAEKERDVANVRGCKVPGVKAWRYSHRQTRRLTHTKMGPEMAFNGPLHGQGVVAGMRVSGGTANVHFHHTGDRPRSGPLRVLPFSRNEDVVIRPAIFSQLDLLLPVSEARSAALWGLGGKTQVALEFAYRRANEDETCSIFWVHADTEATFAQDFALIARKAGLPTSNGEELLMAVCHFIESQPRWLLVLDNADDLRLFGVGATRQNESTTQSATKSLYHHVPKGPYGSVLWTSRDSKIAGTLVGPLRAVEIANMLPKEAQALLATVRGSDISDEEFDDAVALLSELHHIPLPVSQVSAYMRRTALPIKEYLSRLKDGKKRWGLLKRTGFDRHRREGISNSILETWNITIEHLKEEDEAAVRILYILAYVDNRNIPAEIIKAAAAAEICSISGYIRSGSREHACADDESAEDTDESDDVTEEAVTRLREFSFLHRTTAPDGEPMYNMHQLVQEATLYSHSVEKNVEKTACYSTMALRILNTLFPESKRENWEECEKYVRHVLRASKWAEMADDGIVILNLLTKTSNYLYDRERWNERETINDRAYLLRREALSKKHPDTISSMCRLATTYLAQGRYDEAEKLYKEALELDNEVLGERYHSTISSMVCLASTYYAQGGMMRQKRSQHEF
ncbi:phosphorylase superfamily protein [Colletotrichum tofieldiae]|nr:phosphorylase superfamily protein [Colletotrichum tofieldiae]